MRLQELLNKLKVNEEKVGKEILKTTYADAYKKLREEIAAEYCTYAKQYCAGGLLVAKDDSEDTRELYKSINDVFEAFSDELNEGFCVLLQTYSAEKAVEKLQGCKDAVEKAYQVYWVKMCIPTSRGIYNRLNNGYWNPEMKAWEIVQDLSYKDKNGKTVEKTGVTTYSFNNPPYTVIEDANAA